MFRFSLGAVLGLTLALALVLATGGDAFAHSTKSKNAGHTAAKHGGSLSHVGDYDAELVMTGEVLQLYLFDHQGVSPDLTGATGKATVLIGKKASQVPLSGVGGTHLEGAFAGQKEAKVIIRLKLAGKSMLGKFSAHAH